MPTLKELEKLGFIKSDAKVDLVLDVTTSDWVVGECDKPAKCAIANSIRRVQPDSVVWVGIEVVHIARKRRRKSGGVAGDITRYIHSPESKLIACANDEENGAPYIFKPCTVRLMPPVGERTIVKRREGRAKAAARGTTGTFPKQPRRNAWSERSRRRLTGSTNVTLE